MKYEFAKNKMLAKVNEWEITLKKVNPDSPKYAETRIIIDAIMDLMIAADTAIFEAENKGKQEMIKHHGLGTMLKNNWYGK